MPHHRQSKTKPNPQQSPVDSKGVLVTTFAAAVLFLFFIECVQVALAHKMHRNCNELIPQEGRRRQGKEERVALSQTRISRLGLTLRPLRPLPPPAEPVCVPEARALRLFLSPPHRLGQAHGDSTYIC